MSQPTDVKTSLRIGHRTATDADSLKSLIDKEPPWIVLLHLLNPLRAHCGWMPSWFSQLSKFARCRATNLILSRRLHPVNVSTRIPTQQRPANRRHAAPKCSAYRGSHFLRTWQSRNRRLSWALWCTDSRHDDARSIHGRTAPPCISEIPGRESLATFVDASDNESQRKRALSLGQVPVAYSCRGCSTSSDCAAMRWVHACIHHDRS